MSAKRGKTLKLASVLFALVLSASACSNGDDDSSTSTTQAPSTTMNEMSMTPKGPACSQVPTSGPGSVEGMSDDTVGTAASNNPLLTTLVSLVGEAGLVDTLNAPGPYTVFAPINSAFEKIPANDVAALKANKEQLTKVLTYHVVPGRYSIDQLKDGQKLKTAEGQEITIKKSGDSIKANNSDVVCGDVPTANATVMLVDTVLMPPSA